MGRNSVFAQKILFDINGYDYALTAKSICRLTNESRILNRVSIDSNLFDAKTEYLPDVLNLPDPAPVGERHEALAGQFG